MTPTSSASAAAEVCNNVASGQTAVFPAWQWAANTIIPTTQHRSITPCQKAYYQRSTRLSLTLWEEEQTLVFQVECIGIRIGRRLDNNLINGSKLFHFAGVPRRDWNKILKLVGGCRVVEHGPTDLLGIWIPFQKALCFANIANITKQLRPLFDHGVGTLLTDDPNNHRKGCAALVYSTNFRLLSWVFAVTFFRYAERLMFTPSPRVGVGTYRRGKTNTWGSLLDLKKQASVVDLLYALKGLLNLLEHGSAVDLNYEVAKLDCPRCGCGRRGENGFVRASHLTEHLRDFHLLDIPKTNDGGGASGRGKVEEYADIRQADANFTRKDKTARQNTNPDIQQSSSQAKTQIFNHSVPIQNIPRADILVGQSGNAGKERSGYAPSSSPEKSYHLSQALSATSDTGSSFVHGMNLQGIYVDEDLISCIARLKAVDRLMRAFHELFGGRMKEPCESESGESTLDPGTPSTEISDTSGTRTPSDTSDESQDGNDSTSGRSSNKATTVSLTQKETSQKRRRLDSSSQKFDEEGEDEGNKRPVSTSRKRPIVTSLKRLACPFSKRYPDRPPACKGCMYPGFSTTHRVKEHLYRAHLRPVRIRCSRCYEAFENETGLRAHVTAAQRCPESEEPMIEDGLNQEQERNLRNKQRKGVDSSEESKWRKIFQICFPEVLEANIPSPYCDQPHSPSSQELERFESFERERLPQLVRQALEQAVLVAPELTLLEESVKSHIVDIIRTCQDEVHDQFRRTTATAGGLEQSQHQLYDTLLPMLPPLLTNATEGNNTQEPSSILSATRLNSDLNPAPWSPFSAAFAPDPAYSHAEPTLDDVRSSEASSQQLQGSGDSAYGSMLHYSGHTEDALFQNMEADALSMLWENPFPDFPSTSGESSAVGTALGALSQRIPGVTSEMRDCVDSGGDYRSSHTASSLGHDQGGKEPWDKIHD